MRGQKADHRKCLHVGKRLRVLLAIATATASQVVMEGMPVQAIFAFEAGVSQATFSRAVHGRIKGASKGAQKLWCYTSSRVQLLSGQPKSRCLPTGKAGPSLGTERLRRRAAKKPRRRSDAALVETSPEKWRRLAYAALDGLKEYLQDALDPQLVIDQLAVLRRAQDYARRTTERRTQVGERLKPSGKSLVCAR